MGRWRYAVAGILARTPCRRCRVMRASCGTPHSHPSTLVYNTIIFATRWSHPTHEPTPPDALITSTLVYSSSCSVQLCAYHCRRRSGATSPRMRVSLPPSSRTPSIALIQILFTNTRITPCYPRFAHYASVSSNLIVSVAARRLAQCVFAALYRLSSGRFW